MLVDPAVSLVGWAGIFIRNGVNKEMAVVGHCLSSLSSIESVGYGWRHGLFVNDPFTLKSIAEGLALLLIVPTWSEALKWDH